jgi:hypothetical protein
VWEDHVENRSLSLEAKYKVKLVEFMGKLSAGSEVLLKRFLPDNILKEIKILMDEEKYAEVYNLLSEKVKAEAINYKEPC